MESARIHPSNEQLNIISLLFQGYNVIVNAVPGAGKTTTVFFFTLAYRARIKTNPPSNSTCILQLTYNKALKMDVRRRALVSGISPIDELEVHTYHSFLNTYVSSCPDDNSMRNILYSKPIINKMWDYLVIDEAQDITPLYFELIVKILPLIKKNICILGDSYQGIYSFKGADIRFLIYFPYLLATIKPLFSWIYTTLSVSYRLSPTISDFINNQVIGEKRIISFKTNSPKKVLYIRENIWNIEKFILGQIQEYFGLGYVPGDFFVLAPSISANNTKSNTPIRKLENYLIEKGFPCYVPSGDDIFSTRENIMTEKIVFSTFHQSKGRERKIVILLGFDVSYYEYYNTDVESVYTVPSPMYVAMSRASEILILVEGLKLSDPYENTILPFLRNFNSDSLNYDGVKSLPHIESFGTFPEQNKIKPWKNNLLVDQGKTICTSPTQLLKFFSYSHSKEIYENFIPLLTELCPTFFFRRTNEVSPESVSDSRRSDFVGPESVSDFRRTNKVSPESVSGIGSAIQIPSYVVSTFRQDENHLYEDVSAINGIAIPAILEFIHHLRDEKIYYTSIEKYVIPKFYEFINEPADIVTPEFSLIIYEAIESYIKFVEIVENDQKIQERFFSFNGTKSLPIDSPFFKEIIEKYLRISIIYLAMRSGYLNSLKQIKKYDWLTPSMINACMRNLLNEESGSLEGFEFEKRITPIEGYEFPWTIHNRKTNYITNKVISIIGVVDALNETDIYELKCVEALKVEHLLQLIIYAWLWNRVFSDRSKRFSLINIRTGERHYLNLSSDQNFLYLDYVLAQILNSKFNPKEEISDREFVEKYMISH